MIHFCPLNPRTMPVGGAECGLKSLAYKTGQTIYQIKHQLLSNYLIEQLKRPDVPMLLV
jgi:hypothetical protein